MIRLGVIALFIAVTPTAPQAAGDAELIFVGAPVYTMDPARPRAEAVAIAGGRVVVVGSRAEVLERRGPATRVVELDPGDCVIPGLIDSHGHLRNLGKMLSQVSLIGAPSKEECIRRVRERATGFTGGWIEGRGWDQNDWPVQEYPTWRDLEGVSSHPIYLRRVDGHAGWLNRAALSAAGITRDTPDPDGGVIVRDEHGEPTGIVIDNAEDLVVAAMPAPAPAVMDSWMRSAVRHCAELGLVAAHDAGTTRAMLDSYRRLADRGELPIRVYCMLSATDDAFLDEWFTSGPGEFAEGRIVVRAVKLYADGAMGSRGAALLAPYDDDPDNRGLLVTSPERMRDLVSRAHRAGFQPCVHAIGDRGNRLVLDVYEDVLRDDPDPGRYRFRIEHCQMIAPQDFERFRALGVVAAMQPTHATSDMYWVEKRVGRERIRGAYAWRHFADLGVVLGLGSDFPVESADPLWGIYAAVTRQDHEGLPDGGWYPDQCLSMAEAIAGFTAGAACAEFADESRGALAAGMHADVVVLDHNPFESPARDLLATTVRFTVSEGQVVFERR